jgi:hypothetical protein
MIKYVVDQYESILEETRDYPEWNAKIKMEIGEIVSQIFSLHVPNQKLDEIFCAFDKQEFFK